MVQVTSLGSFLGPGGVDPESSEHFRGRSRIKNIFAWWWSTRRISDKHGWLAWWKTSLVIMVEIQITRQTWPMGMMRNHFRWHESNTSYLPRVLQHSGYFCWVGDCLKIELLEHVGPRKYCLEPEWFKNSSPPNFQVLNQKTWIQCYWKLGGRLRRPASWDELSKSQVNGYL